MKTNQRNSSSISSDLRQAYTEADYVVRLPDRHTVLRNGESNDEQSFLFQRAKMLVVITASNPFIQLLSDEENALRNN